MRRALLVSLLLSPLARAQTPDEIAAVLQQHAALALAAHADTRAAAQDLRLAVAAFTAAPTAATLDAARRACQEARQWYGQTAALRLDAGPQERLDAGPIDASFIDGVKGRPNAGLINDRRFAISKKALAAQHQRGGARNLAAGWPVLEFLLWGQDVNEPDRSPEDFTDDQAPNADRRRQVLNAVTELLLDDLDLLLQAWAPDGPGGRNNERARFERGGIDSVGKIIAGLGGLGTLAGLQDHALALGIQNVWLGRYVRRDGTLLQGASLRDLVAGRDAVLAERTTQQIDATLAAAQALQPPFDPERVQKLIASAAQQSRDLADAAVALGLRRPAWGNLKR